MKLAFVRTFALLAFSFVVLLPATAKDAPSRALRPGIPYSGVVRMFGPESRATRLGIRIPSDAYAVEFSISGAVAEELDFNESIFLSRIGEPGLVTGSLTERDPVLATVEISIPDGGGSGVIVSEDGYLLTNWHVVESPDGLPSDDIMIGVSVDHTRPPAERFRAEVIAHAQDRDLALLRITTGRYGEALPAGYRFPSVQLRRSPLSIAEDLQSIGYARYRRRFPEDRLRIARQVRRRDQRWELQRRGARPIAQAMGDSRARRRENRGTAPTRAPRSRLP